MFAALNEYSYIYMYIIAKFDKLLALKPDLNENNLCLMPYTSANHGWNKDKPFLSFKYLVVIT